MSLKKRTKQSVTARPPPVELEVSEDSSGDSSSDEEEDPLPPLWPHQDKAIKAVMASLKRNVRRAAMSLPTGSGKTRIYSSIIHQILIDSRKGKALLLVGSSEQVAQAKRTIQDVYGRSRIDIGVEQGTNRADPRDQM